MPVMPAIRRCSVRCYNRPVLKRPLTLLLAAFAFAQQEPKPEPPAGQPQVKMNYLNVCTPSAEEQAGIKGAMAAVPGKPAFIQDFEISRSEEQTSELQSHLNLVCRLLLEKKKKK